jgi:hypothetical protein
LIYPQAGWKALRLPLPFVCNNVANRRKMDSIMRVKNAKDRNSDAAWCIREKIHGSNTGTA